MQDIKLPKFKAFDYHTISDVNFHISYIAKEDGLFRDVVETKLVEALNALSIKGLLAVGINMRSEMPNEWNIFKSTGAVNLEIKKARLPFFAQRAGVKIRSVTFLAKLSTGTTLDKLKIDSRELTLTVEDLTVEVKIFKGNDTAILLNKPFAFSSVPSGDKDKFEEIVMVVNYGF